MLKSLDVGCGSTVRMHSDVGIDLRRHRGWPRTCLQASAEALPFKSKTFVAVDCHGVLTCVADPERVVREIARVLKPGGTVTLMVAKRTPATRQFGHISPRENRRDYSAQQAGRMLQVAGFHVDRIEACHFYSPVLPVWTNRALCAIRDVFGPDLPVILGRIVPPRWRGRLNVWAHVIT